MGEKCNTITLYASQADPVIEAIERNGVCYSKEAYVRKKYQESAKIFTTAYSWFVREMEKYVKKPDGAEYPYWAFREAYNVDQSMGGNFLTLEVPLDEVLLFDMYDWNKILCLKYIGEDEKDEKQFQDHSSFFRKHRCILPEGYPYRKFHIRRFIPVVRSVLDQPFISIQNQLRMFFEILYDILSLYRISSGLLKNFPDIFMLL